MGSRSIPAAGCRVVHSGTQPKKHGLGSLAHDDKNSPDSLAYQSLLVFTSQGLAIRIIRDGAQMSPDTLHFSTENPMKWDAIYYRFDIRSKRIIIRDR